MARRPLDVQQLLGAEDLAVYVSNLWTKWNSLRSPWLDQAKELRNYLYATDTRTTENKALPWSNSTTTPKLTQIYDNLIANYSAALFPKDKNFQFIPGSADAAKKEKADAVETYMSSKMRQVDFQGTIMECVLDWIIYGSTFGTTEFLRDSFILETGQEVKGYVGPAPIRISPTDIVFDPTVARWRDTPKIVRSLVSYSEAEKIAGEKFPIMMENRGQVSSASETRKSHGYIADGFSSLESYYQSPMVEILTFYGDIYDRATRKLQDRRVVKVVDRAYVVSNEPFPSWFGHDAIYRSVWRKRPDNLWGMGPLDNLVGMQYRMDHLENLKADIWDLTAGPMVKVRGNVDDFAIGPLERIDVGIDGDIEFLTPPTIALQATTEMEILAQRMEEFAGAPRQAMGFRTPGEKTKFEVQVLDNAANRIFNHKAAQFEREFVEPLLTGMFESAKREMAELEIVGSMTDDGVRVFSSITKEDITADGTFRAVGARYFQEQANRVQTLNSLLQVKASIPDVGVHISGKAIAKIMAEELEEDELFVENVAVQEQAATQAAAMDAQVDLEDEQQTKAEMGL